LTKSDRIYIMRQLLKTIYELDRLWIVHRDIKPANILINVKTK